MARRVFAALLSAVMMLTCVLPSFAVDGVTANKQNETKEKYAYERLPQSAVTESSATTEKNPPQYNDGPSDYAFDGRLDTGWHSDYNTKTLPQSIEWQLNGTYLVGKIECLKKSGGSNGIWKSVKVEGKTDGEWFELAVVNNLPNENAVITFAPQNVSALKVTIVDSHNAYSDGTKYASAGEINTYKAVPAGSPARQALREACVQAEQIVADGYTADSFSKLTAALEAGRRILNDQSAEDPALEAATAELEKAVQGLVIDPDHLAGGAPVGSTTTKEPFPTGTAGSTNFRIPSIVTLKHQKNPELNGRMVAAIDARWNHTGDACALDTILSVSDDNGENWKYSFPNFFNDSTNQKASCATAFIDPLMVEGEDGTIYLLADLFPGGVAINTAPRRPDVDNGFRTIDGEKRLVLYTGVDSAQGADHNNTAHSYYVGDFGQEEENGKRFAPVLSVTDGSTAYYVDDHYYLYTAEKAPMYCRQIDGENLNSSNFVQQNVFFYNADLHVRDATYLWLITSKDGGSTWSAPTILNSQVRRDPAVNQFYGVGPGAGLSFVDAEKHNVILLQGYTFTLGRDNYNQVTSFVYSADNGQTWHRAPDATAGAHWSSESALVQIDETTVRQFYRDGSNNLNYTDYIWNPQTKEFTTDSRAVSVSGASKTYNNQLSAIRYSQDHDGKPVYLVSTANGGGGNRSNGRIFVLTLEDDKTMTVLNTYVVNNAKYGYSSLTETEDGNVALLYEGQTKDGRYGEDIYFQIIGKDELIPVKPEENVQLKVGETQTFPANGEIISNEPAGVVEATITTETVQKSQGLIGTDTSFSAGTQSLESALFTFTRQGEGNTYQIGAEHKGQQIYLQLNPAGGTAGYPMAGTAEKSMTLEAVSGSTDRFFIKNASGNRYLYFWQDGKCLFDAIGTMTDNFKSGCSFLLYRPAAEGEESSTELPGFVKVNGLNEIENGGQYLIANDYNGSLYVMRPSTADKSDKFSYILKVSTETTTRTLNLKGLKAGQAVVETEDTIYNVNVNGPVEHTVTFKADGQDDTVIRVNEGGAIGNQLPKAPTKEGHTFAGWFAGETEVNDKTVVKGDMTVTAKWTVNTYTITVDGETHKDVTYGTTLADILPEAPTKEGHTFAGWFVGETEVNDKTVVKGDMTVTAKWTVNTYTVTVDGETHEDVAYGTALADILPEEPAMAGHTFVGWFVGETEVNAETIVKGDMTITSKWSFDAFDDVHENDWFYEGVRYTTAKGLFVGVADRTFAPAAKVTRATMVQILYSYAGKPEVEKTDRFSDVHDDDWFADAVAWAVENGVTAGVGNGEFAPDVTITREELAVMLHGYAKKPNADTELDFVDAENVSSWAENAMKWAVENELMGSVDKNVKRLAPKATATRAEAAVIMMQFDQLEK